MNKTKLTEDQLLEQFNIEELEEKLEMENPYVNFWVMVSGGFSYWWDVICP